jgi:hypothetical protein
MIQKFFVGKSRAEVLDIAGVLLLFLYLLAGVIYSAHLGSQVRFADEGDFLNLSRNLLHGIGYSLDGVHLTACRPPGYPIFLSVLGALGGGIFAFRLAQFFFLGATIVLVSMLAPGKKMFGGVLIVTAVVALYPALFYISGTLYAQPLSAILFILAMVLLLDSPRGWGINVITGLVFGALIFTVPTFLLTMLVTLATAWLLKIIRKRDIIIIILCASLPLIAWGARNEIYLHHFVPVASNSGLNFLVGNNRNAVADQGSDYKGMWEYYHVVVWEGMDEFQANTYYWHVGLTWIKEHPGDALVLYLKKVVNFFNFENEYGNGTNENFSIVMKLVQGFSYFLLLALLGWRLSEIKRFPLISREKLFLIVYVLSAFTSAIFLTRIRLRLPYDFLIIAVVSIHLSRYLKAWINPKDAGRAKEL